MATFKLIESETEIAIVADLAKIIINEFYSPQMPKDHIEFFISEFQSFEKIKEQVETNFEYYLLSNNSQNFGYVGLEFKSDHIVLSKLYILHSERGNNYGAQAIKLCKQRLTDLGLTKIELFVNHLNQGAIQFYERHGFKNIMRTVHTYASGQSETDVLMRFMLD